MKFEFATAGRIIFGTGTVSQVGTLASDFGNRALVMVGGGKTNPSPVLESLKASFVSQEVWQITNEPSIEDVREAANFARAKGYQIVIGFGGGSVMDAAKATAVMITNSGEPLDYLEVIGKGHPIVNVPAPVIAIPTTAGTGSEVTRNAVLSSPEHRVKVSMRSARMLPRVAIVDPEMTYSLPPEVTASTGMDALAQVFEPFVSSRSNPIVDGLCREGLSRVGKALPRAFHNGQDEAAREDMSLISLLGGMALANAGLGAVHGFAGVIGGSFPAPHGALCAALLAPVTQWNIKALRERHPGSAAFQKYETAARLLIGMDTANLEELVVWLLNLRRELQIPTLSRYGIRENNINELVEKSSNASSMKANPVLLTHDEMRAILAEAL